MCNVLMHVDKTAMRFETPDLWYGTTDQLTTSRTDAIIMVVWNQAARDALSLLDAPMDVDGEHRIWPWQSLMQAMRMAAAPYCIGSRHGAEHHVRACSEGVCSSEPPTDQDFKPMPAPKRFHKAPCTPIQPIAAWYYPPDAMEADDISDQFPMTDLAHHAPKRIAYTDGSCQLIESEGQPPRRVIGAGVFAEDGDTRLLVDPNPSGPDCTVLRAELAGILIALKQGFNIIATDSLISLYLIRRTIVKPMSVLFHPYRTILRHIREAIEKMEGAVHLIKCKAHSGLYGNEVADELARKSLTSPCNKWA